MVDEVFPGLRLRGVAEADIEQMTVLNPRDIFSRQDSY
jgi:predicted metal-dependent phosphotriesterase family hydrolase